MSNQENPQFQDYNLSQIINGKEITLISPEIHHQKISKRLFKIIDGYVERRELGEVYYGPLDVIFEENKNRVQPDLIYISKENSEIAENEWIRGTPEFLVEIVSKDTFHLDTVEKKLLYEKFGVKEYWIVFPEQKTVEIYFLRDLHFELFSNASGDEILASRLLAGLHFQADFLFS